MVVLQELTLEVVVEVLVGVLALVVTEDQE
jgi:hypothetical protein